MSTALPPPSTDCPRCLRAPAGVTHTCFPVDRLPPEPEDAPIAEHRLLAATGAACEVLGHYTHLGRLTGCQGQQAAEACLRAADRAERIRAADIERRIARGRT